MPDTTPPVDAGLMHYARTELQREVVRRTLAGERQADIAAALACNSGTVSRTLKVVRERAAGQGYAPEYDLRNPVPEPFAVKGYSQYYDKEGNPGGVWVKTHRDADKVAEGLARWVENLGDSLEGRAKPLPAPVERDSDLWAVIPIGDPHFAMYADPDEVGEHFDLAKARDYTVRAVGNLIARMPPAEECLILELGDLLHTDNASNQTARSRNPLDVDGRWHGACDVALETMQTVVDLALAKFQRVTVRLVPGNHDEHTAYLLGLALDALYRCEPRVTVDRARSVITYYRFGRVMIGATHGHTLKPKDCGGVMSVDQSDQWSAHPFRYFHFGHFHHTEKGAARDECGGVVWEIHRTLAPRDSWHYGEGYRAGRDLQAIVYHREFGEWDRFVCPVDFVKYQIEKESLC